MVNKINKMYDAISINVTDLTIIMSFILKFKKADLMFRPIMSVCLKYVLYTNFAVYNLINKTVAILLKLLLQIDC